MMKGFLKIDRAFFDSDEWKTPRRFSKAEAMLDIQRRAMVYDTEGMDKGEVKLNMKKTAQAWGWCVGSVHKFIHQLIDKGFIKTTGKVGIYTVNDSVNGKVNAKLTENHDSYADSVNDKMNESVNTLPINIKEKIKENACARGTRDANGDEELFARFHEWARQNLPTLASGIDIATFRMMRGRTYGSTAKMLKVLQAMEGDGCQGDILAEYERRCPR